MESAHIERLIIFIIQRISFVIVLLSLRSFNCFSWRSRASVDTAHVIPCFLSGLLSLICELGNFPPLTKKTFIPKRITDKAIIPAVKISTFHIFTIFVEYRRRLGIVHS